MYLEYLISLSVSPSLFYHTIAQLAWSPQHLARRLFHYLDQQRQGNRLLQEHWKISLRCCPDCFRFFPIISHSRSFVFALTTCHSPILGALLSLVALRSSSVSPLFLLLFPVEDLFPLCRRQRALSVESYARSLFSCTTDMVCPPGNIATTAATVTASATAFAATAISNYIGRLLPEIDEGLGIWNAACIGNCHRARTTRGSGTEQQD